MSRKIEWSDDKSMDIPVADPSDMLDVLAPNGKRYKAIAADECCVGCGFREEDDLCTTGATLPCAEGDMVILDGRTHQLVNELIW